MAHLRIDILLPFCPRFEVLLLDPPLFPIVRLAERHGKKSYFFFFPNSAECEFMGKGFQQRPGGSVRGERANFTGLVREAVSKRNFARKYAFESSRRDLQNALLCTALQPQKFMKKLFPLEFLRKISLKFTIF